MKLFKKTLLFFIGIIAFQSALTGLLITNVTRRANLADARGELAAEASIIYEVFNSWKRQMWVSLIGIRNDQRLAHLLSIYRGSLPLEEFTGSLKEFLFVSKIDYLILNDPHSTAVEIVPVGYGTFSAADLSVLSNNKPDPYLELRLIRHVLCLVGVTSLELAPNHQVDLFLLKRIDTEFCNQLSLNRKSRVALFLGARYLVGSFAFGPTPTGIDPRELKNSYLEIYNVKVGGERLNVALQRLGRPQPVKENEELSLGVFLDNEPYNERVRHISRSIILALVLGSAMTVLLSLFLSRNITHPIAELLAGMGSIKTGDYTARVGARGGYEIARLFDGFNEMARELDQNHEAIRKHVQEMVLLKEYNEKIVNSIRAGIAIVDSNLVVEKANTAFVESFGLCDRPVVGVSLGSLSLDIVDESILAKIGEILNRELEVFTAVKRSGSSRVYEIKLYPLYGFKETEATAPGCVLVAEDISARTELEHKIFQAEKLSSISMLSAGMAHEINNPLSSILTNVQNLINEDTNARRKVSLRLIEQETRRIARIVRELLNFASMDAAHVAGCDVNQAAAETIRLVGFTLAREQRIQIDARLAPGLPPSVLSTDELKQVAVNLIKNSVQAIEGKGRILVSTRLERSGERICFSVADTGGGIPKNLIPRIFDPFFTTKNNGDGTGLGLSVVYGIVTKYNGTIQVRSREGGGTRIALGLPVLQGEPV
jgi:signal transduction histidine kinase